MTNSKHNEQGIFISYFTEMGGSLDVIPEKYIWNMY